MADRQVRTRIIRAIGGALLGVAIVGGGVALAADHAVAISGFSFSPAQITVTVGDTITWTNSDAQAHTATADDSSFDSGTVTGNGGTESVTMSAAGTFPYHCRIHPTMTGTVTVQAAGGAAVPPTDTEPATRTDGGSNDGVLAASFLAVVWGAAFVLARRRLTSAR